MKNEEWEKGTGRRKKYVPNMVEDNMAYFLPI